MWKRRELKSEAKRNLKKNYWAMVLVALILLFLASEYSLWGGSALFGSTGESQKGEELIPTGTSAYSQLFGDIANFFEKGESKATRGAMASVLSGLSKGTATLDHAFSAFQSFLGGHGALKGIVSLFAMLFSFGFFMFVQNILRVGERRFYLENRLYHDTSVARILYIYREKKVWNSAKVMLAQSIFLFLWLLTIVGIFIKFYEYKMIPYILAENPDIKRKEAFALSKSMMKGNKWRAFVLDISFFPWILLSAITLGVFAIFFLNPYSRATEAALYMKLRGNVIEAEMPDTELLTDHYLVTEPPERRLDIYPTLELPKQHALKYDWNRHYVFINIVIIFFIMCIIGWCWEVFYEFINHGNLVNRGTMHGPWLPIYGSGGAVILVFLKRFGKNPALLFLITMVVCGIIEYFSAWYLETYKHMKYWDYSGYFLNIQGRVCLEGLLVFAIAGCACVYIIAPRLDTLINKLPLRYRYIIGLSLTGLFCVDIVYSHYFPNEGKGITRSDILDAEKTAFGAYESKTYIVRRLT